jgi:DNA-binding transcriptional ArsR family regulator
MVWALEQDVSASQKLVLTLLANRADEDGICWPGQRGLAERCRIGQRALQKHLASLTKAGLLTSEPRYRADGSRTSNLYQLCMNISTPPSEPADRGVANSGTGGSEPTDGGILESSLNLQEKRQEDIETPDWIQVLERDSRWESRNGYVEDVESIYGQHLNLHSEAIGAYEWLQTSRGKNRVKLGMFFLNWLKRAKGDVPSNNGQQPNMPRADRLRADHKAYKGEI